MWHKRGESLVSSSMEAEEEAAGAEVAGKCNLAISLTMFSLHRRKY